MILGKLRAYMAEIRKEHPNVDISITIPSHLPDDYFSIRVSDINTRFNERRSMSMTDLDAYSGNPEELLITILNRMVEDVERSK